VAPRFVSVEMALSFVTSAIQRLTVPMREAAPCQSRSPRCVAASFTDKPRSRGLLQPRPSLKNGIGRE